MFALILKRGTTGTLPLHLISRWTLRIFRSRLYDAGRIITTLELDMTTTVNQLELLKLRDPIIITGDNAGSVQVHNVTMYQFGRFVTGRQLPARDYSGVLSTEMATLANGARMALISG